MGIRIQHQGAGAGAGMDDGFKRKYEHRIRQQEKMQDKLFQLGMQDRNVALQRENMVIGDNLQQNQRRIARQENQADLVEQRKFQAENQEARDAFEMAKIAKNQEFIQGNQERSLQAQLDMANQQRAQKFEDTAISQRSNFLYQEMREGKFEEDAIPVLQELLRKETELVTKSARDLGIDETQRAEGLARVRDDLRIASIHGRKKMEAQKAPTASEMFMADPKLQESMLGIVSSSLGEEGTMSPAERLFTAQQLYEESQNPQKLRERVLAEKFTQQLPNVKPFEIKGFTENQPEEVKKALSAVQDTNASNDVRMGANVVLQRYGITPQTIEEALRKSASGAGGAGQPQGGDPGASLPKATGFNWDARIGAMKSEQDIRQAKWLKNFASEKPPEVQNAIALLSSPNAQENVRIQAHEYLTNHHNIDLPSLLKDLTPAQTVRRQDR
jgi:hypothetical protein